MIQDLSNQQVEKALEWLASPIVESPPEDLLELTQAEWFLLDRMLSQLMQEKDNGPVH
jgi:hypothetical protein